MSSKTKHDGDVRDSYLEMIKRFPLSSIRDDGHLEEAQKVLDSLFAREPLDEGEEQYLDALTDLIAYYEANNVVFDGVDDVEVLEHLMKAKGISQAKLADDTGLPRSTVSELLSGRRSMSREHIEKFAALFGIEPGAFMKPRKKCR